MDTAILKKFMRKLSDIGIFIPNIVSIAQQRLRNTLCLTAVLVETAKI